MPITDRTRKILWGRSGNRCAICRVTLVVEKRESDAESVVGDECHIHSSSPEGPRYVALAANEADALENLILLCRLHHKMVDDQVEMFSGDALRTTKGNHEAWVESQLQGAAHPPEIRIRPIAGETPAALVRMTSGRQLFELACGRHASTQDYSSDLTTDEVEMVGGFLQALSDWVDIAEEPLESMQAAKAIDSGLKQLERNGFWVFGACERQRIEGGVGPPGDWVVLHISVLRDSDPQILRVDVSRRTTGA